MVFIIQLFDNNAVHKEAHTVQQEVPAVDRGEQSEDRGGWQSKQNIKYELECDLNQQIEWLINDSQKSAKLIAFGFQYKGKMKWFHMQFDDLLKVKNELKQRMSFSNIHSFYYPLNILGQGAQSKVILVKSFLNYQPFASKQIERCGGNEEAKQKQVKDIYQEVEIMKTLSHPNIIKFEEFYVGERSYNIVTEYVRGGTLDGYIQKSIEIDNESIRHIMKQLLSVLAYLNSKDIIHRDIKPSNILIQESNTIGTIKLIDFGFAIKATCCPFVHPKCGTPGYMAPEVIQLKSKEDTYTTKCDVFSAGSLMYKLITRKNLFPGRDSEQIYNINKKCIFSLDLLKMFLHIPNSAKDLVTRMLVIDPARRISALEALQHPYFSDGDTPLELKQSRKNTLDDIPNEGSSKQLVYILQPQLQNHSQKKQHMLLKKSAKHLSQIIKHKNNDYENSLKLH